MTKSRKGQLADIEEESEKRYNISTLKVEGSEDFEQKPVVNPDDYFTSYAQSRKNFSDYGFSLSAYEFEIYNNNARLGSDRGTELFFRRVDGSEPITQTIRVMSRLKAWEYYKDKDSKQKRKVSEFITYSSSLSGYDRYGNEIRCHLPKQGLSYAPDVKIKMSHDEYGKQLEPQYTYDKLRDDHYIKFNKKKVEDLIKSSNTNPQHCKFYVHVGSDPYNNSGIQFRFDGLTFEQFCNSTFEECENIARAPNKHWQAVKPKMEFIG